MVQVPDLPAGNLEQPLTHSKICLSLCSTNHHLGHAGGIYIVDGYIGWLCMYYGEPGRSLDRQTALLWNSLPNWEFWLFHNYVRSGVFLFPDPLAGLSMMGFVQGLDQASLYPVRLFVG